MSVPRRLVLVTTSFPVRGDGSEAAGSFVSDLAQELSLHTTVRVVAPGPQTLREKWAPGLEVFRYAAPSKPLSTLKPWKPTDMRWLVRVLHGGAEATRSAVADEASHIVALWGLPCGEWARRAARTVGAGYSVWLLGSDVWSLGRVPILRGLLGRVIREARSAYADGFALADDARRIAGTPVEFLPSTRKIDLSPATAPAPRSEAPYRLLFLGRWHPNKGIDLLLDALSLLKDEDWRRIERIEIQGGGPMDSQVRERIATLRALGHPVVAGAFLAKAEAEAAIARSDWVLIPSRIESIPVVFSDAMKLGRPVVATPVGDLPRLLAMHSCGVLSRGCDPPSIAQAIAFALGTSALAHGDAVAAAAEPFSLSLIVERLLRSAGTED